MLLIDYWSQHSRCRHVHPYKKTALAISGILLVLILQSVYLAFAVCMFMSACILYSGAPFRYYIKLLRMPVLFLLISILAVIFDIDSNGFHASPGSLYRGILLFMNALACISSMWFLSLTTPLPDIIHVLRRLHCPSIVIELMLLIYRFIFILLYTASQLNKASLSRLGNAGFYRACAAAGQVMTALFIRSWHYSTKIYDAMESRCYNGTIPYLNPWEDT